MDVAPAISGLIARPLGARPLRLPVAPGTKPQLPINELTACVQINWLGGSRAGPLVRIAHGR